MTLARRNFLKQTLLSTALAGLGGVVAAATSPNASGGGGKLVINVKDLGALGDGITDDTAAFHAARDAAGVGGTVIVPSGTYMVSGLTANVDCQTWEFSSNSAVIKMKTGASEILAVTANGVTLVGGVFDGSNGTKSDWSQQGVRVTGDGVTILNAIVQHSPKAGIYATNCNQVTVSGCTIINSNYKGIFVQSHSATGPLNIYDIVITDNLIDNSAGWNGARGIGVRAGDENQQFANRVTISRNTIRLPYGQSMETESIVLTNGADYIVEGNTVIGGFLGISCANTRRGVISNNLVRGFRRAGIEIPLDTIDVTISGNSIDSDGVDSGFGIWASRGRVRAVAISDNAISNFPAGLSAGISFDSRSIVEGATVSGNSITSAVKSGQFIGLRCLGSVANLAITENMIDASSTPESYGMQFICPATGVYIRGNQFSNVAQAAVLLSGLGGPFRDITYVENQVANCGAGLGGNGLASATNLISDSR